MVSYYDTLARLSSQTQTLLRQIDRLRFDDAMLNDTLRNRQLLETSNLSERITNSLRKLLILNSHTSKNIPFEQTVDSAGYGVMLYGDTTVITIPGLPLKEHKQHNCSYVIEPLLRYLEWYVTHNQAIMYDRCIVKFKHIFPEDTPLRQLHDYDNLEVKKILDAIALFFLTDDNIKKCQVHHVGEVGEPMRTEIWITPLDEPKIG